MDTFKIAINITAPEVVEAIKALIGVFKPTSVSIESPAPMFTPPVPAMPVQPQADTTAAPLTPQYQTSIQPLYPAAPAVPAAPVQTAVPTVTAPTYTIEQLSVAGAALVDSGKMNEVRALCQQFGVQSLTALPKERYGEFATALRQLGAKI